MKNTMKKTVSLLMCAVCMLLTVIISPLPAEAANDYEKDIYHFLKNEMGLNDAAACGIVANIEKESNFKPELYGDNGTSYGICQWHKSRFDALKAFCSANGYSYKTVMGQLYYLKYELETSYPATLRDIKSVENTAEGAYYAGYSFCYNFEKPANREVKSEQRGELAQEYWLKYGVLGSMVPQKITSPADKSRVSSADPLKIRWAAGEGHYNRNRLHIVKQYPDGSYDWDSEQKIITSLNTLSYTFGAGELSNGNYLIWVEPWYTVKEMAGPASKAITVTVYDELYYDTETDIEGVVFDASVEESVDVTGWAVDTGRHPVEVTFSLDGGVKEYAEKTERADIAVSDEYGDYCPDEFAGFWVNLPLADLSNGEHTVEITASGESVSELVAEFTFTVVNGHDHSFTDYIYNGDATYFADGTKTAKCDFCNTRSTITDEGTKKVLGVAEEFTADTRDAFTVLSWSEVEGASYYRVYIYSSGWKVIEETEELSYTVNELIPSGKYRFAVKACLKDEEENTVMAPSYVSLSTVCLPSNLETLTASVNFDSVTLAWNESEGATGYRIYIYNNEAKKWDIVLRATHETSAVIKGIEAGKTYKYAVRPYYNSGEGIYWAKSYISKTVTAKLATPELKALHSSAKGRVTISWGKSAHADGYQIWVAEESGSFRKVSNFKIRSTYLYDYESGKTYRFKVRAYKKTDSGYVYSSYTDVKTVKIK